MASNFKILSRRSCDKLYLKLMGDFDGTSAHEVINAMRENAWAECIFIHTTDIKGIDPFGKAIFERNLPVFEKLHTKIIFTGKHAGQFVSDVAALCYS